MQLGFASTYAFLDILVQSFPDMAAIADGSLDPGALRKRSLLGSVVMQRVLAGAYHDLIVGTDWQLTGQKPMNRLQVRAFFERLSKHMSAPVAADSVWVQYTDQFTQDTAAPMARTQDLQNLTGKIVSWARNEPDWLLRG